MHRCGAALLAMTQGALLIAALAVVSQGNSPMLAALREWRTPLVVAVALLAALRMCRGDVGGKKSPPRACAMLPYGPLIVLVIATFAALASLWQDTALRQQRDAARVGDATGRAVGAHLMVGYTRFDEVALLARRGLIGGVYLTRRNVRDRDVGEIRAEIDTLQALRREAGLPPLLVAADQEGGEVAHMSPPLPAPASLASLLRASEGDGAAQASELAARARAHGLAQGGQLARLGVNLNFGPVVDLVPQRPPPRNIAAKLTQLDTHTRLRTRAISGDAGTVTLVARAYNDGLLSAGVRPTLKHFPGLARVGVDTHHRLGRIDEPLAELATSDWQPFASLTHSGAAIMVGHVVLNAIDPQEPASLSSKVIVGLLRERWGFTGLVVTDDLNMGAVARRGVGQAAVHALAAGADVALISYDPAQVYAALLAGRRALEAGELDANALQISARRIAHAVGANGRSQPMM